MVPFYKYHALGNDYIVIDPNQAKLILTPARIRLICHRNFGVGSDGILYGPIEGDVPAVRIFNPDGSEAEKSGNGIRIFSRYLFEAGYVKAKQFKLDTLGGRVSVEYLDDKASSIRVAMGRATFLSDGIPVSGPSRQVVNETMTFGDAAYQVTCASVGNPHCVIPVERATRVLACALGPLVENHPAFPNRINMQLLEVINRANIRIEIWERGAGYTLASGSSSCAAACAAHRLGLVDDHQTVHMPGGDIDIRIQPDGMVLMTGSVNSVASGTFTADFLAELEALSR